MSVEQVGLQGIVRLDWIFDPRWFSQIRSALRTGLGR